MPLSFTMYTFISSCSKGSWKSKSKNMENLATQLFYCFFFLVLLVVHSSSPATSQEVEDEKEFNYEAGGEHGPDRWGELHSEWSACKNGSMQSPIDLLDERVEVVSHLGRLKRRYKPSNATLRNRGHDMMLKWEGGAGSIEINGTEYVLNQIHWHSPSEHTLNGEGFDLEAHMVHESTDGKIAVVGIMYKIGRPDSFLSSIKDHLAAIGGSTKRDTVVGMIDPRDIKIGSRKYYRYLGSLTIPPCTENVLWTIVRKVRTVTREQVRSLRVAVHDDSNANARPLQPINLRSLQLFRPNDDVTQKP
ncbi:alpha carbonic anhydrase 7-like [Mangifera indica]|uniref:alpha carbonic anhydrase 7-like n=1 Tax=Mangifera indica TaxID=29780 RepID=UPI001CFB4CDB|nr:alpha carbonic anhydrase 7-like [Mangifera indica]XP_044505278.1 alpha carbonic anhydrase 7-like [Mangifera indica]